MSEEKREDDKKEAEKHESDSLHSDGLKSGESADGESAKQEEHADKEMASSPADVPQQVTPDLPPGGLEAEKAAGAAAAAETSPAVDSEREAKLKAAAEARAARAAAKAKAEAEAAEAEAAQPKEPSPRQPELDRVAELLRSEVSPDAVLEAGLNELNGDMPMLALEPAHWPAAAELLKRHEELRFDYLRNVSGIDYETHLEVVYHLLSMASHREVAVKLRTDRELPSLPSAAPVWATANWNEREIYDLLGVKFEGHPDLRRIMMPDDWEGHPLRKDYEPLDSEV